MAINLEKGQKINLTKTGDASGDRLTNIRMGLGWDTAQSGGFFGFGGSSENIDLDASCGLFDENKRLIDTVSFRKLRSSDGSIQHSGDNLTGAGDGEDEKIFLNLPAVNQNVKSIVFTVNSYRGQTFDKVNNCFVRLADTSVGDPHQGHTVAEFKLGQGLNKSALIMCKLYRHNGEWKMAAIGNYTNGRTFEELVPEIQNYL